MLHLKENEKIILIKRRHWLVLLLHMLPIVLSFALLTAAMLALPFVSLGPVTDLLTSIHFPLSAFNLKLTAAFLLALSLLVFWQTLFVQIAHYYLDCWLITDERTVHTELHGLFNRTLSSVYHHRVQDVSVDVKGILPTFFNYGNVQVQTAGAFRQFFFREIPDPYQTKETILQAQKDFLTKIKDKGTLPEQREKD